MVNCAIEEVNFGYLAVTQALSSVEPHNSLRFDAKTSFSKLVLAANMKPRLVELNRLIAHCCHVGANSISECVAQEVR